MVRRGLSWLLLSLALLALASPVYAASEAEARALALEKKLMAPCCWQGTLEFHHSELADTLHAEIRMRLRLGESAASIEESLVARFGARLLAVPSPGLLEGTAGVVMLGLLVAGAFLWMLGRSWSRHAVQSSPARGADSEPTSLLVYEARVDAELERLK